MTCFRKTICVRWKFSLEKESILLNESNNILTCDQIASHILILLELILKMVPDNIDA